jgi:hypothetical protein
MSDSAMRTDTRSFARSPLRGGSAADGPALSPRLLRQHIAANQGSFFAYIMQRKKPISSMVHFLCHRLGSGRLNKRQHWRVAPLMAVKKLSLTFSAWLSVSLAERAHDAIEAAILKVVEPSAIGARSGASRRGPRRLGPRPYQELQDLLIRSYKISLSGVTRSPYQELQDLLIRSYKISQWLWTIL